MTPLPRTTKRVLASAAAASALLMAAACGTDDANDPDPDPDPSSSPTDDWSVSNGGYMPGTYSAEGSYSTPGGRQSVEVEVTLEIDGTITDITVTPLADGGNSEQFQTQFAGGIADEVVGENIEDLDVSKVSGSSLTSGGFNDAIAEIRSKAAD